MMNNTLPQDSEARKELPLATGVFDYFPAALAAVANLSKAGNDKHNPGEPLHWARGKSMDHADCIARHLIDRGSFDPKDGTRHSAALAWRALALLQEELEAEGEPMSRGSRVVEEKPGLIVDRMYAPAPFTAAVAAGWTEGKKWVVRTPEWMDKCIAAPGTCMVCWRDAEPGEVIDPKTAMRVPA